MIVSHRDAVVALLEAADLTVYEGGSPAGATAPYVVLYADGGSADQSSLASVSDWRMWRVQATCVGVNDTTAKTVASLVETALLDVRPTVSGRSCSPLRKEISRPVLRDDDVQPAVFYAIETYTFSTVPA